MLRRLNQQEQNASGQKIKSKGSFLGPHRFRKPRSGLPIHVSPPLQPLILRLHLNNIQINHHRQIIRFNNSSKGEKTYWRWISLRLKWWNRYVEYINWQPKKSAVEGDLLHNINREYQIYEKRWKTSRIR